MINRQLFSGCKPCSSNCSYCFAKWAEYTPQRKLDVWESRNLASVVYPCCDSEISKNNEVIEELWRMAKKTKNIYISIAVKGEIDSNVLDLYKKLNQYLKEKGKGFIKFSISLTTKYRLSEIEPNTANYNERQDIFSHLKCAGFYTSVILKPILPFISINEYKEIIDDFSECNYFLLGDLYVNENTDFFKKYIKGKYQLEQHAITWLEEHPVWQRISQRDRIKTIELYIHSMNRKAFQCDVDLIEYMSKCGGE